MTRGHDGAKQHRNGTGDMLRNVFSGVDTYEHPRHTNRETSPEPYLVTNHLRDRPVGCETSPVN